MIERLEVTAGAGTVIRFGGIVAWADGAASPALISFLAQSARNLGPSPRGGRQIADHIASVLSSRDPEPLVGFAVIGPSDHGWATLLHGPAQAWDGAKWLAPARSPGWVQAIITARPTVTVGPAGSPLPPVQPDSMLDLEAGVVPGAGFLLLPAIRAVAVGTVATAAGRESAADADDLRSDSTPADRSTEIIAVGGAIPGSRGAPPADDHFGSRAPEPDVAEPEVTATPSGGVDHVGAGLLAAGAAAELARREAKGRDSASEADPTRVQPAIGSAEEPLTLEMQALQSSAPQAATAAAAAAAAAAARPAAETAPVESPAAGSEPQADPGPTVHRRRRPDLPGPPGSLDLESVTFTSRSPLPRSGGPDQRIAGVPLVAGVLCSRGHLNRTALARCVKCHAPIDEATAQRTSGSRPPLGVIVTDDGGIYRVDQGYVVGSDPGRDPTVGGGVARPLLLQGADVSSTHAEIRLQEWDAVVVDRGSAAGTSVFEPGAAGWERCRPFEPRALPPGTHVAFGQRVVTFVGPWRRSQNQS
jgi:hypothetical protein